jgi:hypothetical protein
VLEIAQPYLAETDYASLDEERRAHFHLQAAHLLTWSAVERLAALMFGPDSDGDAVTRRIGRFGDVDSWPNLFRRAGIRSNDRHVYRSNRRNDSEQIDPNGRRAWDFWYQVRSNLSHRGKSTRRDLDIVREALVDVHDVLRLLLLHSVPEIETAWAEANPEGKARQWRIRPTLRSQ